MRLDREVHTMIRPNDTDFDPATLHDWPADSRKATCGRGRPTLTVVWRSREIKYDNTIN